MDDLDDLLDDLFHGAAFAAYVEEACLAQGPPYPIKTKVRAYRYYEEALAEKNAEPKTAQLSAVGFRE